MRSSPLPLPSPSTMSCHFVLTMTARSHSSSVAFPENALTTAQVVTNGPRMNWNVYQRLWLVYDAISNIMIYVRLLICCKGTMTPLADPVPSISFLMAAMLTGTRATSTLTGRRASWHCLRTGRAEPTEAIAMGIEDFSEDDPVVIALRLLLLLLFFTSFLRQLRKKRVNGASLSVTNIVIKHLRVFARSHGTLLTARILSPRLILSRCSQVLIHRQ